MNRTGLLSRINDKSLRAAVENALGVSARFAARRQAVDRDVRLTESGRLDALAAELAKSYAPEFRLAKHPIADARAAIDARRAKIRLPDLDKTDIVGALERMEIRGFVAALEPAARTRLLFETDDNRIVDAVLSAPAALSGLPQDQHAELLDKRLRQLHGAEMDAVDHAERDLAEAEAAVKVAETDMKASFDPKADGRRFDEIVNRKVIPWLFDHGNGNVVVVKIGPDGKADYPPASELEKQTGQFFKNRQEWEAAQAA